MSLKVIKFLFGYSFQGREKCLKEKIKDANGRRLKKAYEKPKTPYQRLIESGYLDEAKKEGK